jgi:general secretion pathway protein D
LKACTRTLKAIIPIAIWLLAGCASEMHVRESSSLLAEGKIEEGLAELQKEMEQSPRNHELRNYYFRQRELQLTTLLSQADIARKQGEFAEAEATYQRALNIDHNSKRAQAGIDAIALERRHQERLKESETQFKKGNVPAASAMVQAVLTEVPGHKEALGLKRRIAEKTTAGNTATPVLKSAKSKPVSLEFRDASIKSVFELLSRNAGINFVFDREVRPDLKTTLFIKNSSVEDVVRLVLLTNQLEQKVLNENTVLIYPSTPAKQKEYQELVTKSFYIANVDVKTVVNTIKTVVKTKDIIVDEKLNYLVMRDTPEAIRLAEKLIANQDIPDPEVILELEVLEVSSNRLKEIGIRYPEQLGVSVVGEDDTAGTLRLEEAKHFNSGLVRLTVTNPSLIFNLRRVDSDTNLLANPRIRVKNREKAKVHVGERVPVITTTSTANVGVSESVNYLDVGLKLEVEPIITLDDEVSNILETITRASGLQTYRLGTRNTATTLMLADGETQVLAGLIQDDDRKTSNKVPGLSDLPLVGRLFTNRNDINTKTEIVLLITPRVVRNIARPEAQDSEFLSGTEAAIGAMPIVLRQSEPAPAQKPLTPSLPSMPVQTPASPANETPATPVSSQPVEIPAGTTEATTTGAPAAPAKPTLPLPSAFANPGKL